MKSASSRVAEEFDNVVVKCTIIEPSSMNFDREFTFSVGYGDESCIPKFVDDGVVGLSAGDSKEISVDIQSLSKDERQFLCLEKTSAHLSSFTIKLLKLQKVNWHCYS